MANITENTQSPAWSNGIYQIETSDPVLGGANGIANRQAKELAARTQWLKTELAKAVSSIGTNKSSADSAIATKANNTVTLTAGNGLTGGGNLTANRTFALGTPSSITASTTNSVTADSHTHAIDKASTSVAGIVQLYNGLDSSNASRALTAAQGKALNDKITANASDTTTNLATKANNTLTLTAGNGLTGGGNLTANRTFALGTPSSITADSKNAVTADSHTHAVATATTSRAGIVQLYDGLGGTYTDRALTAAQGKVLNDKITTNASDTTTNLATKANNTLTLTAGNGLTGGGNLTANRTFAIGTPSSITASTTNSVTADSHTHEINKASTSVAGIVQLNNTLTSTATNQALTAAQGKALNENILNAIKNGLQFKGIIGTKNLNDLFGAENYGIWQCLQNSNASEEQNYPVLKAGALLVIPSTNVGTQIYIPYGVYRIYIRYSRGEGVLSDWYTLAQAINNLNSTSAIEPLSAAQGKVLNDKITNLAITGQNSINGYCKLPNGLIFQWGRTNIDGSSGSVNFPIAFPNALYNVQFTDVLAAGSATNNIPYMAWISENSNTSKFVINCSRTVGLFNWFAIGI